MLQMIGRKILRRISQKLKTSPNLCDFRRRNITTSVGIFGEPKLKKADGFLILESQARQKCDELVREAFSSNRKRKMVQIFDDISDSICCVADLAECMRNLHPDPQFASSAEDCVARMGELVESFNTNFELYDRLKKNLNEGDSTDQRVASLFAADFEASGVHLDKNQKNKFVEITSNIFRYSAEFVRNCDLPKEIPMSPGNPQPIRVDNPSINSPSSSVRQIGYKFYYSPSKSQEILLKSLLKERNKLARLVGYPTYAHRALRSSLLETPENVESFLLSIVEKLKPIAEKELILLKKYSNGGETIGLWDLPYLTEIARRDLLGEISDELNDAFDVDSTINGLNEIVRRLFKVSVERARPENGELWQTDVEKLWVKNFDGNILGTIYCDWYDRPNKTVTDSHFTVRCGRRLADGGYQHPIVVLSFKLRRKKFGLTINEVENLLHEFGHAFHSVLGRTRYQHVSGTRCSTDFAEIPSNFMENFLLHRRILPLLSKNEKIHDQNSIAKIQRATRSFESLDLLRQAIYSLFDLRLHSTKEIDDRSTKDIFAELCRETWPFMNVDGTAWHHRFSHLVHYGSKYHAYLVAESSANAIWRRCFADDPFNEESGRRWREVLSYGGERSPADLLSLILHKTPSVYELSGAIVENIK